MAVRAPELIAGSGTYLDRSACCTWRFVCHRLCRDGRSGRVRVCRSPACESSPHLHRMQSSHSSSASSPSSRPLTTKEIEHQEQSSTEGNTALSALFPGDGRREETLCPQQLGEGSRQKTHPTLERVESDRKLSLPQAEAEPRWTTG